MPTTDELDIHAQLRAKAESQLQAGTARAGSQWSLGVDALQMLHRLSSNPESAEDALKLLHELQVHQVELDLQNEEIAAHERSMAGDLELYRELFDAAPVGYFLVNLEGRITQGNHAAAELFDAEQDELGGQTLDTFLHPASRPQLHSLLQNIAQDGAQGSCIAEVSEHAQSIGTRHVQLLASIPSSGREHILVACCPCAGIE